MNLARMMSKIVGMTYGGMDEAAWRHQLHSLSPLLRITALRALAGMGEVGARALLTGPSFAQPGLSYPWVWAMTRCLSPETFRVIRLSGHPSHDLLARVRFLLCRRQREHSWQVRRSRSQCLEAMALAIHPLQTLACAVRLLELHGESAVPALLELIRQGPPAAPPGVERQLGLPELLEEKAECAAWALGQLGRACLPELVHDFGHSSPRVQNHLAMAVWYLGTDGTPAMSALLKHDSPASRAALVAMESRASVAVVEHRRGPVWLDSDSVCALAILAYSDQDRAYAAGCLGGFGPAAASTLPILEYLAGDADPSVRVRLTQGLSWGGRPESMAMLTSLLDDPAPDVQRRVRAALRSFPQSSRQQLWASFLDTPRESTARQLAEFGLPVDHEAQVDRMLAECEGLTLAYLLGAVAQLPHPGAHQARILRHLEHPRHEVRYAAAAAARRLPDSGQLRGAWRKRLYDTDPDVAELAVKALAASGHRRWTESELRHLAPQTLSLLLQALSPGQVETRLLLGLLKRGEVATRVCAAHALGDHTRATRATLKALLRGRYDPLSAVALACSRALGRLGYPERAWLLLVSPDPQERAQAYGFFLKLPKLPQELLDAFVSGVLVEPTAIRLLQNRLSVESLLDLFEQTWMNVVAWQADLLAEELARLNRAGLLRLPELLGHPQPLVQRSAVRALATILEGPAEIAYEWLAQQALTLPNPGPDGLQCALMDFVQRSQAWRDPRFTLLLGELSRSGAEGVAGRALELLGRAYAVRPEDCLAELVLAGLNHAGPGPRLRALATAVTQLPVEFWTVTAEGSFERRLLAQAGRFAAQGLPPDELREGLEWAAGAPGNWDALFAPRDSAQVACLLACLPACREAVLKRLWLYTGPLDGPTWRKIFRCATDPEQPVLQADLVQRWPRLVGVALACLPEAAGWVIGLGRAAIKGLLEALDSKGSARRHRTLEVLEHWPDRPRALRLRLRKLALTDPDPEVRKRAEALC